ncbi:anaphase promoting complex subunit 5 [Mortierella sp. AM989]|nr:anaphase promoting complex subunit 5 [Mortierella sp. AM989]
MSSRRPFARTATDISLRPPQLQGSSSTEQAVATDFVNEHLRGTIADQYDFKSDPDPLEYLHDNVNKFGSIITSEIGPDVWTHVCVTLTRIKSPHHLSDFFLSKLEMDVTDPKDIAPHKIGLKDLVIMRGVIAAEDPGQSIKLDPESIMGLYVRKARIEYKKLSFEDMCKFYTALETYISTIDRGNQHSGSSHPPSLKPQESTVLSSFDMEKYLDHHTQKLAGQIDIPEDLLAHVYSIQSRLPSLAKTHYIKCLHAQQTGDFEVAIQSLHRFFDYSMAVHDRELYQYALLNLAMLHARFSHYEQALIALRETIEIARDHMDQECLSYALNWLYRLTRTTSGASSEAHEAQILANLNGKTDGQAFQYLHSLSELTMAKQLQGESMPKALSSLVKASSINLKHSLDGVGGIVQLFQSKIWGAYGYPSLSSLYSQLQLQYRPSETDMNDAASGYSKTASDLALAGRFQEALRVIELAKTKFPLKTMKAAPWIQTLVQILHKRAISTNQLRDAEILTQQLGTTLVDTSIIAGVSDVGTSKGDDGGRGSSRESQLDDTTREVQLEIILQKALLNVLVGQSQTGAQQLSEGLTIIQKNQWPGTQKFTVMYLLALAEIYMESDSATSAMPLLLTAMTLSEHNMQRPLLLLVKLRLSEVLLYIDSTKQASELVDGLMSMVLSQGDVYVQALAYFQRAKCLLARVDIAEPLQTADNTRKSQLKHVIEHLERALEGFQRIESLKEIAQVLYFQVRVYHMLGNTYDIEKALHLYRLSSLKLSSGKNNREPSWFSYYYVRDSFEGILETDSGKSSFNGLETRAASKPDDPSRLDQKKVVNSGGFGRAGSSQWNSLRRAPSQLWQTTTVPEPGSALSPPDEHDESFGSRSDNDSMDIDLGLRDGRSPF